MSNMDQVVYAPKAAKHQRIAMSTDGEATALIAAIATMGWVRVAVRGGYAQVVFGDSDDTVPVLDSTTQAEIGYHIADGTYHDFWLTNETHILWDASADGYIDIYRAGQERVKT